jgi:hypothetical protein
LRIASRRPFTASSSLGALLASGLVAGLLVAAGALVTLRFASDSASNVTERSSLSMADAFGLGGLASLAPRGIEGAPSPAQHDAIVTYYGSPRTPSMGILGQHTPDEAADLLAERAARFEALSDGAPVLPAIHLVYAVAQPQAKSDGLYLQYLDDRTVRQYIELARRRGFVLILDLQIGHSNALAEVVKIAPYLEEPDVFVALDPEFALGGSEKPGDAIGSIDASDINAVQWYLAALSAQRHLPKKMLIVHQFQAEMISNTAAIERRDGVDLVIDMDGYGPADIKEAKYARYGAAPYATYGGIKVFLQHDPDPLTEARLLQLTPRPSLFVYQ